MIGFLEKNFHFWNWCMRIFTFTGVWDLIGILENFFHFWNWCMRIFSFTGVLDLIRILENIFHFENWCMRNSNVLAHTISHSTNPLCSWFAKRSIHLFLHNDIFLSHLLCNESELANNDNLWRGGRWARQLKKLLCGVENISENVKEVQFAVKENVNVALSYFPCGLDSV